MSESPILLPAPVEGLGVETLIGMESGKDLGMESGIDSNTETGIDSGME